MAHPIAPSIALIDPTNARLRSSSHVAALSDTDFGTKGALGGTSCLIMDVPMRGMTDLEPHSLCHAPDAGQPVKFVLVNNRTPRRQSCCAICGEPIRETYLRAIATRLAYCDFRCYATVAVLTTQHRAKAS